MVLVFPARSLPSDASPLTGGLFRMHRDGVLNLVDPEDVDLADSWCEDSSQFPHLGTDVPLSGEFRL